MCATRARQWRGILCPRLNQFLFGTRPARPVDHRSQPRRRPWEDIASSSPTVFRDDGLWRHQRRSPPPCCFSVIVGLNSFSLGASVTGKVILYRPSFARRQHVSADVVSEHSSDEDIGRKVFACDHACCRDTRRQRVNDQLGSPPVVFLCHYVRERPGQDRVIGRHGLPIRPGLWTMGPEVSFPVALHGRLAIDAIAKPGIQNERINHRLFREDRGLLQMMVVLGAAGQEPDSDNA